MRVVRRERGIYWGRVRGVGGREREVEDEGKSGAKEGDRKG